MTVRRYSERRRILDALDLNGPYRTTPCAFDDGEALRQAICERGLEPRLQALQQRRIELVLAAPKGGASVATIAKLSGMSRQRVNTIVRRAR
jgi:hypothetical protein